MTEAKADAEGSARKRVRLRDVAAAAQVSVTQASAALAGYTDVSAVTRRRVEEVARSLGYQPSEHARLLRGRTKTAIRCAVVLTGGYSGASPIASFLSSMLDGVVLRASELGMDIRLVAVSPEQMRSGKAFDALLARDGADVVVVQTFEDLLPEQVEPLRAANIPFVLLNRHFDGEPGVPSVVADVKTGAQHVLDHLVKLGHQRIALLVQHRETSVVRDYESGWQLGIEKHGLDPEQAVVLRVDQDDAVGWEKAVTRLLGEGLADGRGRPTAAIAVNEVVAHAILAEATRRGISVPEQLTVMTFESVIAPYTTPALCGYDLHIQQVGAGAIDILAQAMKDGGRDATTRWIAPELICRETCAAAQVR